MFKNSSLESSLEYLYGMYKPSELILVGTKVESWLKIAKELDVTSVHYIDTDEQQVRKLKSLHALPENWSVYNTLLHKESAQIPFYKLSNPALNGTVSSEVLSKLWGNLRTIETVERNAVSLHELLKDLVVHDMVKWLVIDCFASLDILKGTHALLNNIEVVVARTVVDDAELSDISKEKLDSWMSEKGYKHITIFEENHPKVGMSLYVKDYKSLTAQLNSIKQESQKALELEKQSKVKEVETLNKTLQDRQKENEILTSQLNKNNSDLKDIQVKYKDLKTEQSIKENIFEYELKNVTDQLELIKRVLDEK